MIVFIRTAVFENRPELRSANRVCFVAWLALINFFPFTPAFAVQQPLEETVVVTANAYPVPFENLSRTVTVLTREDISKLPAYSIADVLAQAVSVDIRSRSPFGIQADISLRGSAYSQSLVLVDGVRINDSQTGHHNADFPVQLQDVERIEVLMGAGSSIYGADAFGGIVNIITRRGVEGTQASLSVEQYGLVDGSVSVGFGEGKLKQSISASGNRSSGFQYDRDFRSVSLSSRTNVGERFSLFVSHLNKEFGANGFYGPAPSKEWTNQTFVALESNFSRPSGLKGSFQGYYRTHGDRFLYDIRYPDQYENTHRTHAAGLTAKTRFGVSEAGSLLVGGEVGGDWIVSSNLGNHSFAKMSVFGELQWTLGKNAIIYPGLRLDHYSAFGTAASPSLSGSWWVFPRIRLRSSVGRSFRIPTFTELYYKDPNNQGNPALNPESAWSAEVGTDFIPARNWLGFLNYFYRHERNVIDWIRSSGDEKWRAFNIRRIHASGIEVGIEHSLGMKAHLTTRYSRISMNAGEFNYRSKYVLDYARHSWATTASIPIPFGLEYKQTLRYKRRIDGRSYWLLDGRLENHSGKFIIAVDITNLLNSRYQEIIGVDMPGRWLAVTLRTK
jgi:outer membrane cobalamin receptor